MLMVQPSFSDEFEACEGVGMSMEPNLDLGSNGPWETQGGESGVITMTGR